MLSRDAHVHTSAEMKSTQALGFYLIKEEVRAKRSEYAV